MLVFRGVTSPTKGKIVFKNALKRGEYMLNSQEGTLEKIHLQVCPTQPGQRMNINDLKGLKIAGEIMSNRHPVTVG